MRTASLLVVLLLAKALVLAGHDVAWSWWAPVAYIWQDVLVVLLFALLTVTTRRRPWVAKSFYGLLALYAAVNVPVAQLLSTPLTWMMLRATRGTLSDSILHHINGPNLLRVGLVLAVAVVLPSGLRRLWRRVTRR